MMYVSVDNMVSVTLMISVTQKHSGRTWRGWNSEMCKQKGVSYHATK